MEDHKVAVGLRGRNGIHFNIVMDEEVANKMGEIRGEDPQKWEDEMELKKEAHRRLEAEKQQNQA